jgi:hypothetical protein
MPKIWCVESRFLNWRTIGGGHSHAQNSVLTCISNNVGDRPRGPLKQWGILT